MRTKNPAATSDNGAVIHGNWPKHRYIAAQVPQNPPNEVASCPILRAKTGAWNGSVARR